VGWRSLQGGYILQRALPVPCLRAPPALPGGRWIALPPAAACSRREELMRSCGSTLGVPVCGLGPLFFSFACFVPFRSILLIFPIPFFFEGSSQISPLQRTGVVVAPTRFGPHRVAGSSSATKGPRGWVGRCACELSALGSCPFQPCFSLFDYYVRLLVLNFGSLPPKKKGIGPPLRKMLKSYFCHSKCSPYGVQ
jgi:hypothetical protein